MITAVAVSGTGCSQTQPASIDYKTADKVADGAILQAFCWDFNTIKESMGDIAAAGFSAVQTSPINECLEGEDGGMDLYGNGKWYYHYQPTDFKIGNYQLGTRDEFKAMCDEAHKYGIKVIVDVIANHTTPATDEVSEDRSHDTARNQGQGYRNGKLYDTAVKILIDTGSGFHRNRQDTVCISAQQHKARLT